MTGIWRSPYPILAIPTETRWLSRRYHGFTGVFGIRFTTFFWARLKKYDHSFDVHFQLATETETRPGVAIGLRDFGGTGI